MNDWFLIIGGISGIVTIGMLIVAGRAAIHFERCRNDQCGRKTP